MTKGIFDTVVRGQGNFAQYAYFFTDNQYVRYDLLNDRVDQGPQSIVGHWGQFNTWPGSFANGVDAALTGTGTFAGKGWFFKGNQYIRYNFAQDTVEQGLRTIAGNWNFPSSFLNGIDAAIHGVGSFDGKAWFFKGDQCIRYNIEQDVLESGPTTIVSSWGTNNPGIFPSAIDGGVYGTGENEGKIYFFRGNQYLRYDPLGDLVEAGPLPVAGNWPGLYEQWYGQGTIWGVDSVTPATNLMAGAGSQTLFDYVTDKCGMQPAFWGRYLDSLTRNEAQFLIGHGCRILPIYRGASTVSVAGGRPAGANDAARAIAQAQAVGVQPGANIYADIEPGWAPVRDWFLGWWDGMTPSLYNDGIYFNGQANSPFNQPYTDAFAMRAAGAPATYLWSQFPQRPNFADNRGCPIAREALQRVYEPVTHPSNPDNTVLWQFKINCLPFPFPGDIHAPVGPNKGFIDNNLATADGLAGMWGT